ncbi:Nuclear transcription factor Y subunit C [Melia azedarach]|uniref:Nuclear transcription factor Y subunit C n=1 Tax=Melia azedarach TaxID=155640 RepID=A0ACC1X6K4_MELAZ|nr:Nuclear transcription factor Y subunit C [Melia azedarach]
MRRPKVDLNQALEFKSSTPSPQQQVHNFMPMTPFLLPYHQVTIEDEEEATNFCLMQKQKQNIDMFWNRQLFEIYNTTVFKSNHQLPLARIKRIMKFNGDVKMISADTPIVFAKACELFILELTLRAWLQTEECNRRTLQRCDIARALRLDELLDFLVDFVPCNFHKDDESDKSSEEINELHPANQVYFPGVDINEVGDIQLRHPQSL